jgi:integrase
MSNRSTFSILFYLAKSKVKKNGKCPVMGRITVDGKSVQFSLQEETEPELWSVRENRSTGKDKQSKDLNLKLEKYRDVISSLYSAQIEHDGYVSAEVLKNALAESGKERMLLNELDGILNDMKPTVGIQMKPATFKGYQAFRSSVKRFIGWKYHTEDFAISRLDLSFIEEYESFLRLEMNYQTNTVHGFTVKLRYIGKRLRRKGLMSANPFEGFVCCRPKRDDRRWLAKEELERIMQTPMKDKKTNFIRNLFVFSAFTGLSFADMYDLRWEHITKDEYGVTWIRKRRKKTDIESSVPLLGLPLRFLEKHGKKERSENIFDIPPYRTACDHMAKIGKAVGIQPLGFHMARHTWATTICLSNSVSIETLSRTMGHSSITTTQIYGKITNQKINEDMTKLEQRLDGQFDFHPTEVSPIKIEELWNEEK